MKLLSLKRSVKTKRNVIKTLKIRLLNSLLRHLFNTFTVGEFLTVQVIKDSKGKLNSKVWAGKFQLPDSDANLMGSEARSIQKMLVWRRVVDDMKSQATDALVNKSKIIDDMVFSKAMLYTLDMLEKKLEQLSNI